VLGIAERFASCANRLPQIGFSMPLMVLADQRARFSGRNLIYRVEIHDQENIHKICLLNVREIQIIYE
jgi:hypothetical protein